MADSNYDLAVIGAGPGGYYAAIRAAQLGMRTVCIEKDAALGGTCLNVGCIPSKALLDSSERFAQARHSLAAHGINVQGVELDLQVMMKRKDRIVTALTKGIGSLFKKNKIESIQGRAKLLGAGRVGIDGEEGKSEITARRILIASGSAPIELPSLPFDGKRIISSTEALTLKSVPSRMLVVGAGAIGLEMGSVWARLGAEVTVVELLDHIVPGADRECSAALQKLLEKQGFVFRLNTTAQDAAVSDDAVSVSLAAKDRGEVEKQEFEIVLVAVGRRAYAEGLGLDAVGLKTDERGRIPVNQHYATEVEGIYAIGDVIAGPMLAHKAEEEGAACVERMAGVAGHVNYDAVASVVYTWPELASVGMTEEEATAEGHELRIGKFPFRANGRAKCMDEQDGMVKIIADAADDRVLGVHILGANASELIAEAAIAVEFSACAEDIARSVHAHPTLAEAVKEAAMAVDGRAIHF